MTQRGHRRTGRLGLLCVVALAACGAFAAHASAETKQVEFVFDDGRINIGQFKGERLIDPAIPDRVGSLIGLIETSTGDFSAPATGVVIPDHVFKNAPTPAGDADVVLHLSAVSPVAGNLAPGTGVLRTDLLELSGEVSVYQAGQPESETNLIARCQVSPVPLHLSTSGQLVDDHDPTNPVAYDAAPFAPRGAAVATWDSLPPSQATGGTFGAAACPFIDQMAGGPGGVWLSGLADLTEVPAAPNAGKPSSGGRGAKCKRAKKKGKHKHKRKRCRKTARTAI